MSEVAMGGPETPPPNRSRREFPSFVRIPGIELRLESEERQGPKPLPPRDEAPVPTQAEALAALERYRQFPTPKDNELVQRWIADAKDDPREQARRIGLTS